MEIRILEIWQNWIWLHEQEQKEYDAQNYPWMDFKPVEMPSLTLMRAIIDWDV